MMHEANWRRLNIASESIASKNAQDLYLILHQLFFTRLIEFFNVIDDIIDY